MSLGFDPYCGAAPLPVQLWSRWNLDPWLIAALLIFAAFYARARFRSANPFGPRTGWFTLGMLVLVIAFISPLCALSSALFSARAIHHVLVIGLAAPLLAAAGVATARPMVPLPPAILLQALALWIWHAPQAYALALVHPGVYWLMELSLAGAAWLYWNAAWRARDNPLAVIAAMALTMAQMGLLGAFLSGAAEPFYAPHLTTTGPWGLSTLEDQQLAGVIMWAPGALPYLIAALLCIGRWLASPDGLVSDRSGRATPARARR